MDKLSKFIPRVYKEKVNIFLFSIVIFIVTFFLYQQYDYLLGRKNIDLTQWDWLAKSFLQGKLYLSSPPSTWDLTFFQGHWYVPEPPLPAILMLPLLILVGNVNTVLFSIFFSALNSLLLFMILYQLSHLGWIKTSITGIIWLVVLFAFGTPHWWVGMNGRVWYVSQIVAITFVALAVLSALLSWSPWLVGFCLGMAIFSRPNVILIWPLIFAIAAQLRKDKNKQLQTKPLVRWTIKTIIPIGIFVAGLFFYNYLRFRNIFDFGYATINGNPPLVEAVRKYGMFSPHFISQNLYVMFLKLPVISLVKPYLDPSYVGISIFITTPAFLYLIHRYEKKLWIIGAWVSVILSLGMLSLYSSSGQVQFGYRYILDLIIPVMILMAVSLNRKIPWLLLLLILLSIAINEYGAFWIIKYIGG